MFGQAATRREKRDRSLDVPSSSSSSSSSPSGSNSMAVLSSTGLAEPSEKKKKK